jgi:TetR/AcrR family transcriptional repressor of nem operon
VNQTKDTRENIIEAAHRLLLKRGMNGFSYRDIAEPLGVRNAAIHYHFPSKMDLVEALIEDNHDVLRKSTAEFMAYGGEARPQLEGLFAFTRQQFDNGRPVCIIGSLSVDLEELSESARRSLDGFMQDTLAWLTKVLETGREQGEFEFRGKAVAKASAILATIQGARQLARIHGVELLEATFAQIRTDLGMET